MALVFAVELQRGCTAVHFLSHTSMAYILLPGRKTEYSMGETSTIWITCMLRSFILDQIIHADTLKINSWCIEGQQIKPALLRSLEKSLT